MRMVDRKGEVTVVRVVKCTKREQVEKSRDIAIVRMRHQNHSWRVIGAFVGMSNRGVQKRWERIPEAVREHYRRQALG